MISRDFYFYDNWFYISHHFELLFIEHLHSSSRLWSKLKLVANENWKLFVIKPVLILYMLQYSIGSTVNDQVRKFDVTITIIRYEIEFYIEHI